MGFEEMLDHATAMLQRRGRLTYRTLKRQFHLDDDLLEDLKEELIYGQRVAVDEEGRVLVWRGAMAPIPRPARIKTVLRDCTRLRTSPRRSSRPRSPWRANA